MPSNEFFYKKPNGRKGDDWIHEELTMNESADLFTRLMSFHSVVIDDGFEPLEAQQMYNIEPAHLGTEENLQVVRMRAGMGKTSYTIAKS